LARAYVTTALAAVRADPDLVLYDGGVPADVMVGWFGPSARASVVLSTVSAVDRPTDDLRMLDATGTPRHVVLVDTVPARPGPVAACGYAVTAAGTDVRLAAGRPVVRIGYYAATGGSGTVRVGGRPVPVRFAGGVHELYVVAGSARDVRITSGGTVCVTDVVAGVPVP
jgi:hypothetical protein